VLAAVEGLRAVKRRVGMVGVVVLVLGVA